jgi:hypothetical protein
MTALLPLCFVELLVSSVSPLFKMWPNSPKKNPKVEGSREWPLGTPSKGPTYIKRTPKEHVSSDAT